MLILNLASAELKNEIKLRHIYFLIKKVNSVLIILTIVIAVILIAAKIILQNNFNKIVEQTTLVTKNNQGYNSKIRQINNELNYIAKIQDNFVYWSNLIEELTKITPNDVTFYSIKANDSKKVIITGRTKLRDSLLRLKDSMENSSTFKNIDFPLKNILEKTDIDFSITADINLENLTK